MSREIRATGWCLADTHTPLLPSSTGPSMQLLHIHWGFTGALAGRGDLAGSLVVRRQSMALWVAEYQHVDSGRVCGVTGPVLMAKQP